MPSTLTGLRDRNRAAAPVTTATAAPPTRGMKEIMAMPKERRFPAMLDSFKREITLALPAHLTAERMARLAMTAFSQNAKLAECDPRSVFAAVILSSQLGLEIGVDGQAYLVPYKGQATFVPGWKGYVELINRAGRASVWTGAVFEGDKFEYAQGDSPYIKHHPMGATDENEGNLLFTYAVGRVHGAEWPVIEVWPKSRILRHRNKFNKVGNSHYSYSNDDSFIAYARKVPLMQVMKYMPKSVELRAAAAAEHGSSIDLKDVLEGEWSQVAATAELEDGRGGIDTSTGEVIDHQGEDTATDDAKPATRTDAEPHQAAASTTRTRRMLE